MQKSCLGRGFHTFTNRVKSQRSCHLHQFGEHDLSALALIKPLHEAHVKFDQIKFDALQNVQGGVTAAEIIHPDSKSKLTEPFDLFFHEIKIIADDAFGDLYRYHIPPETRGINAIPDLFNDITGIEIRPGKIDRMRNDRKPAFLHILHLEQSLFQHKKIQLIDQSCFFKMRNEICGGQESLLGIYPSGEGFFIAYLAVYSPDDRLVIDFDPVLSDRTVYICLDIPALYFIFAEFFVIEVTGGSIRSRDRITGNLGSVISFAGSDILYARWINAYPYGKRILSVYLFRFGKEAVEDFLQSFFFSAYGKTVSSDMTAVLTSESLFQQPCKVLEHPVAFRKSFPVVVILHAV